MIRKFGLAVAVCLGAPTVSAQEVGSADFSYVDGMLVTSADVNSCPYRFVQAITVSVTEDYGDDTQEKVHEKLRRSARRLGADAVVLVTRGDSHMSAFAFSRREYHGRAIRYVDRSCAPSEL